MDYATKGKDKSDVNPEDFPNIRIILKSRETRNLQYVADMIIRNAKEKQFQVRGPRYMPTKHLTLTVRKSPCGEGTNTFDAYEMKIHTRIIDIKCSPNDVSDITHFQIKAGVDINIKIWND